MASSWNKFLLAFIAVAKPSHGHLHDLLSFWVGSSHTSQLDSSPAAQITPPPPPPVQDLRRRQQDSNAQITVVDGPYTMIDQVGSLCGYITQDVHAPIYCDQGLFCFTTDKFLQCCSSTVDSTTTTNYVYTMITTDRDVGGTSTSLSTDEDPSPLTSTYGTSCAAPTTTCYHYNDTASATAGALVCTNSNFPYCASLYAATDDGGDEATGVVSKTGVTYRCDTAEYGLEYYAGGYSPSVTSTFTPQVTSSGVPFTPSVVPYSKTQASRPGSSSAVEARETATSVPSSVSASAGLSMFRDVPRSIIWTISFWLVMASLNVLLYLLYEYLYAEKADRWVDR
ncbi:hypothetical protein H2204_007572 [Knufia peltigerae]|uniref:Uncharacterized protein n=1 Tax=Knufia peltigerae TaxID=1002370 RepID=A0AA38Y1H7_9EURO|nr:hypothetical protein H2204_007572 [Knufia peltigerae]